MAALQSIRDNALYAYGYVQGRSFLLPHSLSDVYALAVSKLTSLIALPLPFFSFLALPFFGGTSTSINLVFFYLTWSALVLSHDQLTIELYGTLAVRLLCFLLPALGFLAFDLAAPSVSKAIKAKGEKQLPSKLSRNKLLEVTGVAIFNVLLAVALQAEFEFGTTEVLHLRSVLAISSVVPLPWTMAKDVLKGFVVRGVVHYYVHRYLLHTYRSPLRTWHLRWQHSVKLPFSLVAAYDHPICYLLAQWLPLFATAVVFRMHVLTWHVLLALVSLEDLFVYSGYAVLRSSIILAGMARRTDAHFASVKAGKPADFGHWGILDFVSGTSYNGEADVMDDVQDEAEKHRFQERAQDAVNGALASIKGKDENENDSTSTDEAGDGIDYMPEEDDAKAGEDRPIDQGGEDASDSVKNADQITEDDDSNEAPASPPKRRSARRQLRKA